MQMQDPMGGVFRGFDIAATGLRADLIRLVRQDSTWILDRTIVGGVEVRP